MILKRAKKKKDCQNQQRFQKGSTPVTRVNITNTSGKRVYNNKIYSGGLKKDLSQIIYYNYDKKKYYIDKCLESKKISYQKISNNLSNLHVND